MKEESPELKNHLGKSELAQLSGDAELAEA
jgi:hypothetical protein